MIKFWDPIKQYLKHKDELDSALQDVLLSGNLVLGAGDYVEKFEKEFAQFVGRKHAIMVRNGTSALYLSYKVLGVGPGDEVIVPSNTFIASIDQVAALGARPILIDCDEDGLMDLKEASRSITNGTKLIVPVHMEGKVCEAMRRLPYPKHVRVVEDAAQAIGAKEVGLGSIQCYSLFPAKLLGAFGNAGIITTDDDIWAERLRMLRCNSNIGKNPNMDAELGMNMEPDNRDAAWLSVKIKYLPQALSRRKEIADKYLDAFKELPFVLPSNQNGRVWQDFMIRSTERDKLQDFLAEHDIQALIPSPRIPNHHYNVIKCELPRTDSYIRTKLALPCNDTISDEEVDKVVEVVRSFYE